MTRDLIEERYVQELAGLLAEALVSAMNLGTASRADAESFAGSEDLEDLRTAVQQIQTFSGRFEDLSDVPTFATPGDIAALRTQLIEEFGLTLPGDDPIGIVQWTTIPIVELQSSAGTATLDLRQYGSVPNGTFDEVSWSVNATGFTVSGGILDVPLDDPRQLTVTVTATTAAGPSAVRVTVRITPDEVDDMTPPVLSEPYLVNDQAAGEILAGLGTSEQATVRFLVIPEGAPAPTPAQFTENRDGSGALALASAVLQSAGPGAVRAPISWTLDQRARVVAMATDAAGNSTRMEIGSLSNRTLVARFDAPDGTALADYSPEVGAGPTDVGDGLVISNGYVTGPGFSRHWFQPVSSGHGRVRVAGKVSEDGEYEYVSVAFAGIAAQVSASSVRLRNHRPSDGHISNVFDEITKNQPLDVDFVIEIHVTPEKRTLYVDGSVIHESEGSYSDPNGDVRLGNDGTGAVNDITFDGVVYAPSLSGAIIDGGADQPQEPVTLGFATQPDLSITGDAASYDVGAPAWPADATGRTITVTLADEDGVLLETSGLDNPSGQTAAGTGLHTLTVTLGADGYEPVSVTVTAMERGDNTGGETPADGDGPQAMSAGGAYELRSADGSAAYSYSGDSSGFHYVDDSDPVIEWTSGNGSGGGDLASITTFPPVAYRESNGPLVKHVLWRATPPQSNIADLNTIASDSATVSSVSGNTATLAYNGANRVQGVVRIDTEPDQPYRIDFSMGGISGDFVNTSLAVSDSEDVFASPEHKTDEYSDSYEFVGTGEPKYLAFDVSDAGTDTFDWEVHARPDVETKEEETADPSHVFSYERAANQSRHVITATYTPWERHGDALESRVSNEIQTA